MDIMSSIFNSNLSETYSDPMVSAWKKFIPIITSSMLCPNILTLALSKIVSAHLSTILKDQAHFPIKHYSMIGLYRRQKQ